MKNKGDIRRRRLAELRDEVGTLKALADLVGTDEAYLGQLLHAYPNESGNPRRITDAMAERLEKAGKKPEGWMSDEATNAAADAIAFRPLLAWEHEDELPPGDVVAIPRFAVQLSAGHGHDQPEIALLKERPQIFSADWIRRMRLSPKALRVMYADGNSMEPRIQDGDALVVDISQTSVVDGRVYALWYPGGERVKRLTLRPGGGLIIASDNEREHPTITLSETEAQAVTIIGRVVNTSGHKGL